MFDDKILEEYINTFLGYGNSKGDICFIGLEEGIAVEYLQLERNPRLGFDEVNKKLQIWKSREKKELEDCRDFHLATNDIWHNTNSKIQRTWQGSIRTVLSYEGKDTNDSNILDFQINRLGRFNENHSIIELRPLPSKKVAGSKWFYKFFSKIDYLKSKKDYEMFITHKRIENIKKFINRSSFKHIVFLSLAGEYRSYWKKIASTEFKNIDIEASRVALNIYMKRTGKDFIVSSDNKFIITHHPKSYPDNDDLVCGSLAQVFVELGKYLKSLKV